MDEDPPEDPGPTGIPDEPNGNKWRLLVANVMAGLGIVTLGLSGLCSSFFGVTAVRNIALSRRGGGSWDLLALALVIGGPFMLTGAGLWWTGRRLRRRWRRGDDQGPNPI